MSPGLVLPADDDLALVLRERWTVDPVLRLVRANQQDLARWEPWAVGEVTREALAEATVAGMHEFAEGRSLPTLIRWRGELVGALAAQIDPERSIADVGYWLDVSARGRGVVTRSTAAFVDHLLHDRGLARVELRMASDNVRSRAVAERLGFRHEGTLRSAFPIGSRRQDIEVHALLRDPAQR